MMHNSINNNALKYFTISLMFSYVLIFSGILPRLEIFNTINSLISVLIFFIWYILRFGLCIIYKNFLPFMIFVGWLLGVNLANLVFLTDLNSCIYDANVLSVIVLVFLILVANNKIFNICNIKKMLYAVVYFAIISSVINILTNYENIINLANIDRAYDAKFTGLFLGRNQFGAYLFLSIVSCVYLRDIYNENISIWVLGFLLFNLILTFSRTPILATGIFIIISKLRMSKVRSVMAMSILCLMLFVMYFFTPLGELSDKFLIRSSVGSAGRITRWLALLSLVAENPIMLLGISPAGFKEFLLNSGFGFAHIDNAYLEILVSYGLIGVFLYTGVFLMNVVLIRKIETTFDIKRCLVSFTVAYFIYNLFEAIILFEAGLTQWVATILLIALPRCFFKTGKDDLKIL